jgi:hypothetical protein
MDAQRGSWHQVRIAERARDVIGVVGAAFLGRVNVVEEALGIRQAAARRIVPFDLAAQKKNVLAGPAMIQAVGFRELGLRDVYGLRSAMIGMAGWCTRT